jgi:excisionase family DNA binding protein
VKFYTPAEVAELLKVSPRTVRDLCGRPGGITPHRIGGSLRIEAGELARYLEAARVPTPDPTDEPSDPRPKGVRSLVAVNPGYAVADFRALVEKHLPPRDATPPAAR